eukprot:s2411_g1.t1
MDALRKEQRVLDLEWEDSAEVVEAQLDSGPKEAAALDELLGALQWARERQRKGEMVMVNCAQGRSRSATFTIAYVMATCDVDVDEAYARVKKARPFIHPNAGFMKQLHRWQTNLKGVESKGYRHRESTAKSLHFLKVVAAGARCPPKKFVTHHFATLELVKKVMRRRGKLQQLAVTMLVGG